MSISFYKPNIKMPECVSKFKTPECVGKFQAKLQTMLPGRPDMKEWAAKSEAYFTSGMPGKSTSTLNHWDSRFVTKARVLLNTVTFRVLSFVLTQCYTSRYADVKDFNHRVKKYAEVMQQESELSAVRTAAKTCFLAKKTMIKSWDRFESFDCSRSALGKNYESAKLAYENALIEFKAVCKKTSDITMKKFIEAEAQTTCSEDQELLNGEIIALSQDAGWFSGPTLSELEVRPLVLQNGTALLKANKAYAASLSDEVVKLTAVIKDLGKSASPKVSKAINEKLAEKKSELAVAEAYIQKKTTDMNTLNTQLKSEEYWNTGSYGKYAWTFVKSQEVTV